MKVDTRLIHSASITRRRGVTSAKLTHTVAGGRYTTAPLIFPAKKGGIKVLPAQVSASGPLRHY